MMFKYFVEGSEEFKKELSLMDKIIGSEEDFDPEMVNDEETAEILVVSALIYKDDNAKPKKGLVDAIKAMVKGGSYTFLSLHRYALRLEDEIEGGEYETNLERIVLDWMDAEKERGRRDDDIDESHKGFCHEDDLPF